MCHSAVKNNVHWNRSNILASNELRLFMAIGASRIQPPFMVGRIFGRAADAANMTHLADGAPGMVFGQRARANDSARGW